MNTEKEFKDKNLLLSSSYDGSIKVWNVDATENEPIRTVTNEGSEVNCLALLRKYLLASGHADCKIRIWDLYSDECVKELTGHEGEVTSLVLLNHFLLASASFDGKIILWKQPSCVFNCVIACAKLCLEKISSNFSN